MAWRALLLALSACLTLGAMGRPHGEAGRTLLRPGARVAFDVTAYCQDGTTKSGVDTRHGIAAADPKVLPVGSVVRIDTPQRRHRGIYTVLDTGSAVKGRVIDLFIRDCAEATEFGRRQVVVTVLRLGWSPQSSVQREVR